MNEEIQFKEEQWPQQFVSKKSWGEKLAEALVKYSGSLIKNEKQANHVILVLIAIIFIISFVIFLNAF